MKQQRIESRFSPEQKQEFGYEILANRETRERLKDRMLRFVKAVHDRHVDSLVFLDRSARPLSWMFQDVWGGVYAHEPKPDIKFANIGTPSHIHAGSSHMLEAAQGGSFISDEALLKSEKNDVWFSPNVIPEDWQKELMHQTAAVQELQQRYKNVFDAKHVLIVDEMVASGKSQLIALGLFSLAFTKAKQTESVGLFRSTTRSGGGYTEDTQFMPWLGVPGMTSVLELPNEEMLSGAMTQENLKKIQTEIDQKIQTNREQAKQEVPLFLSGLDGIVSVVRVHQEADPSFLAGILEVFDTVRQSIRVFVEDSSANAFDTQAFYQHTRKVFQMIRKDSSDASQHVRRLFDQALEHAPSVYMHDVKELQKERIAYEDLDTLKKRAMQLRKELEQLAMEAHKDSLKKIKPLV